MLCFFYDLGDMKVLGDELAGLRHIFWFRCSFAALKIKENKLLVSDDCVLCHSVHFLFVHMQYIEDTGLLQ